MVHTPEILHDQRPVSIRSFARGCVFEIHFNVRFEGDPQGDFKIESETQSAAK